MRNQYRAVTWDDRHLLLAWRNDPVTRSFSFSSHVVSLPDHESWLAESLRNTRRKLVLIERERTPVGLLRFDWTNDDDIELSIHVAPNARQQGVGWSALTDAKWLVKAWWSGAKTLYAKVRPENHASLRTFEKADFTRSEVATDIPYIQFQLDI